MRLALVCFYCLCVFVYVLYFIATMSFAGYFLSVLFCLLSMLISDSRFDLVWFRLSCDHGWIRSGSVNVRKQQKQQQQLPYAIGSVPSLSGHAIAYRWRSLPRVRRHRASKPQDRYKRVLPWQVTMHGPINMCLSFPHHPQYWYEVGLLKVPAPLSAIIARRATDNFSLQH